MEAAADAWLPDPIVSERLSLRTPRPDDDDTVRGRLLRAALVDVGGTLWPDRWPDSTRGLYVERLSQRFHLTPDETDGLLAELGARDPGLIRPLPIVQDSYAMAVDALVAAGIEGVDPDELLRAMDVRARHVVEPLEGAGDFLERLKSLGLRTIVFTNATYRSAAACRQDFDDFGLGSFVDEIISSVDLGYRKPSQRMFHAALHAARCSPGEAVVVGDSEEKDIRPGSALGTRTVLVAIETPRPTTSDADAVAASLDEAAGVIGRWTASSL